MGSSSLNEFVSKVTDDANDTLSGVGSADRRNILTAIAPALITSAATVAAAGINAMSSDTIADSLRPGVRRQMRFRIHSKHWGCLRLAVGTLETTFIIPPATDDDDDDDGYVRDDEFYIVLDNGRSQSTSTISAEYTGLLGRNSDGEFAEKMESMMFMSKFDTRSDVYLLINHTETIPKLLISANRDDIDDWGNGEN